MITIMLKNLTTIIVQQQNRQSNNVQNNNTNNNKQTKTKEYEVNLLFMTVILIEMSVIKQQD
jgi:hypothetical protein